MLPTPTHIFPTTTPLYLRIVREIARFLERSPETATVEDLRRYPLHLVDHGTSPVSLNRAMTGLKLFFTVTLDQPELMVRMQPLHAPRTSPVHDQRLHWRLKRQRDARGDTLETCSPICRARLFS